MAGVVENNFSIFIGCSIDSEYTKLIPKHTYIYSLGCWYSKCINLVITELTFTY